MTDGLCEGCQFCCITNAKNKAFDPLTTLYCGTYIECNPLLYLNYMIPVIICVSFLFLCVACFIKRDPNRQNFSAVQGNVRNIVVEEVKTSTYLLEENKKSVDSEKQN